MVGSGTRKARAISAVLSPPSNRRVGATWAAGPSAGWQQVKMSRVLGEVDAAQQAGQHGDRPAVLGAEGLAQP